jgi:hypothetical protein
MQDDTASTAESQAERLAYSINGFAKAADFSRTSVYAEIRAGKLKAKRRGSRTIITAEAARAYLDSLPDVAKAA